MLTKEGQVLKRVVLDSQKTQQNKTPEIRFRRCSKYVM